MHRHEIAQFAAAIAVVVVAAAALVLAPAESTSVRAAKVATGPALPDTAPKPQPTPASGPSSECPQMTNPGGKLAWEPRADAGPWPTGGTVTIRKLGVTAPIVRVGVGASGMVVPRNARDIAWLDQGPLPGRTNNVVLAGHVAYSRRIGSFNQIGRLRPGDFVHVNIDGKDWTFKVAWNCAFSRDSEFANQIMGYTTEPSVTLITCGGAFDRAAGTHNKRIAVRGELVRAS